MCTQIYEILVMLVGNWVENSNREIPKKRTLLKVYLPAGCVDVICLQAGKSTGMGTPVRTGYSARKH